MEYWMIVQLSFCFLAWCMQIVLSILGYSDIGFLICLSIIILGSIIGRIGIDIKYR